MQGRKPSRSGHLLIWVAQLGWPRMPGTKQSQASFQVFGETVRGPREDLRPVLKNGSGKMRNVQRKPSVETYSTDKKRVRGSRNWQGPQVQNSPL